MNKNNRSMHYMEDHNILVGTRVRTLVDPETGWEMDVEQTTKLLYGSKHFWKCYMSEFLKVMESLNGKQVKVFIYIIRHTRPSDNTFIGTYDKIVKGAECSRQTVAVTIKKLKKYGFIKKIQNGVWLINPDVLMKGNVFKHDSLRKKYDKTPPVKVEEAETDSNVKKDNKKTNSVKQKNKKKADSDTKKVTT